MVTIKKQNKFDLYEETKAIVLTNDLTNELVIEVDKLFQNYLIDYTKDDITKIPTMGKLKTQNIYVVNKDSLNNNKVFDQLANIKENVVILADTFKVEDTDYFENMIEKLITKKYEMNTYKSEKKEKHIEISFVGDFEGFETGIVLGEQINKCKDLVNTPYNYLNATDLANYAKTLEKYDNVCVEILDKKQCEELNMGAFLGVNKGSSDEPKLISVKYKGKSEFKDPTALVGKGVMYDTGGYSLKTPTSMPGMKVDMAGSAAVLTAIEAIARLKLKENVIAVVAATDNRIGDGAIVPDDILTAANGKTIEIVSTDAEGRLTLADAVWFAQKEGAKKVIDIATLTGAMVMALGSTFTGAFTNDIEFYNKFKTITDKTKELIWEMPVVKAYHDELKSQVADMKNKGGRTAGSSQAAAFIENFIEEGTKWIHLDVAGTATDKNGGTGIMVKSFTKLFM
jgi:leucyl aminopeptidase